MTQNQAILSYLRLHKSITSKEAVRELDVMRLSERIREMKKAGHKFDIERPRVLTPYGWTIIARYHLIKEAGE